MDTRNPFGAAPGLAHPNHIAVDRRAPLAQFEQIVAQYPVFRIGARGTAETGPSTGVGRGS
jgi:hypothetical protein